VGDVGNAMVNSAITSVPYYALTAGLTDDCDERASLTTSRLALGGAGLPGGCRLDPSHDWSVCHQTAGFGYVGILYGIIAAVVLSVSAAGIGERKKVSERGAETPPLRAAAATFRTRPLMTHHWNRH
jgi:Na+/melibiose symporter-like transporter